MADPISSPEREDLINRLKAIFDKLKVEHKLTINDISKATLETESILADYKRGKIPYKNLDVPYAVLSKLEMLENTERIKKNGKPVSTQDDGGAPDPKNPSSVSEPKAISRIILDLLGQNDPEPYNGDYEVIGYPFKKEDGRDFMITDPNDSKKYKDAEGVVPSYAPGWTNYEFGIIRIRIKNCSWGHRYYIWDIYKQAYYVSLYEDKDQQGYYKLIHNDPIKYPEKKLHESEILVVFKVTIKLLLD
jgi:hypothetical protein